MSVLWEVFVGREAKKGGVSSVGGFFGRALKRGVKTPEKEEKVGQWNRWGSPQVEMDRGFSHNRPGNQKISFFTGKGERWTINVSKQI